MAAGQGKAQGQAFDPVVLVEDYVADGRDPIVILRSLERWQNEADDIVSAMERRVTKAKDNLEQSKEALAAAKVHAAEAASRVRDARSAM